MGGRALNQLNIQTRRYETAEYIDLQNELRPGVEELFNTEIHFVKCYHTKDTHGDMDILIKNTGKLGNIRTKIQDEFNPAGIYCNGDVYSFDYKEFQIDIIQQPESNWETAKCFYDYDPTGNLMGKVAYRFGLKYGFDGLKYLYRLDDKKMGDIVVSKDNRKIFEFLGYDYDRYLQGFEKKQDIFDYIVNGKYFDPSKFQMDKLTHIDRKRNQKRQTYQEFLTFINSNNFEPKFKFKRKDAYLKEIDKYFPEANFSKKIKEFRKKEKERRLIASRFNGYFVMDWTGLEGKELGYCMTSFKQHIQAKTNMDFNQYILHIDDEQDIKLEFAYFYVTYRELFQLKKCQILKSIKILFINLQNCHCQNFI